MIFLKHCLHYFTFISVQQLALFWFIYTEIGRIDYSWPPSASKASPENAEGLLNQVKEMSFEERLQVQQDLVNRKNGLISREYGALSGTTKLLGTIALLSIRLS